MSGLVSELPSLERVPPNGARRRIGDKECIYYDGYWIRYYDPPGETLAEKQQLIDQLTRRLFHHTELGINTPSGRLDTARAAYERETDPRRKRVCGAMLAGALFNRATDIFTSIVELAARGIETSPDNELMRECESCFVEALTLGKTVKHYSGHEGIDELWGEPLKAFSMSMADCYWSRYAKIAQTMRDIDRIADALVEQIEGDERLRGARPLVRAFARAAKDETETMRTDVAIFDVWPRVRRVRGTLARFSSGGAAPRRRERSAARRGRTAPAARRHQPADLPRRRPGADAEEHAGVSGALPPVPGTPPSRPLTGAASGPLLPGPRIQQVDQPQPRIRGEPAIECHPSASVLDRQGGMAGIGNPIARRRQRGWSR